MWVIAFKFYIVRPIIKITMYSWNTENKPPCTGVVRQWLESWVVGTTFNWGGHYISLTAMRRCLPWPPQSAVGWPLFFYSAALGCGAQRTQVFLCEVVVRWRVPCQSSLCMRLYVLFGVEAFPLLDMVTMIHKVQRPTLLLQLSQDADCHF